MPPEEKERKMEDYWRPSKLRPELRINIVDTQNSASNGARNLSNARL
jgi:hypothetical protein